MLDNEELVKAVEELKALKYKWKRTFKYDEVDLRSIELNPNLRFVCNGDKKEVEVLRDE